MAKKTLIYDESNNTYNGERLIFYFCDGDNKWIFTNDKKQIVGWLEKVRVGAWMHWCYYLSHDFYLSPGCSDEVREMQRILGGKEY